MLSSIDIYILTLPLTTAHAPISPRVCGSPHDLCTTHHAPAARFGERIGAKVYQRGDATLVHWPTAKCSPLLPTRREDLADPDYLASVSAYVQLVLTTHLVVPPAPLTVHQLRTHQPPPTEVIIPTPSQATHPSPNYVNRTSTDGTVHLHRTLPNYTRLPSLTITTHPYVRVPAYQPGTVRTGR